MTKVMKLFAPCKITKGAKRSLIQDLQRSQLFIVPTTLNDFITNHEGQSYEVIKSEYDEGEHPIVDEYIEFLSEKEIIFFTSNPDLFPLMSNYWQGVYNKLHI